MKLLLAISLLCWFAGAVLILYARTKYILPSAPALFDTNPISPFSIRRQKAWFSGPGFNLHATGVLIFLAGMLANVIYWSVLTL
jgi:hypothetical protein